MATQVRLVFPIHPGPYLPAGMLLSNCVCCRIPLENVHVQSCPRRFRHERALSFPCRPQPDRRQVDGADHSCPRHGDAALCRAPARDRRDFAEDAHPDIARVSSATASLRAKCIRSSRPRWNTPLTPLGRTLIEPLNAICHWAEKHLPQLKRTAPVLGRLLPNWRGSASLGTPGACAMHHAEPVVLLLVLVAGLVIVANKWAVPYPVVLGARRIDPELRSVSSSHPARSEPGPLFLLSATASYPAALFTSWRDFRRNLALDPFSRHRSGAHDDRRGRMGRALLHRRFAWAAAFALGAIVSPPDAVAAEAILKRLRVPARIQTGAGRRESGQRRHRARRLPIRGRRPW